MSHDQLAPSGFVIVERILVQLPLSVLATERLVSFVCGLASMLVIAPLARRCVERRALALADHLIYNVGRLSGVPIPGTGGSGNAFSRGSGNVLAGGSKTGRASESNS